LLLEEAFRLQRQHDTMKKVAKYLVAQEARNPELVDSILEAPTTLDAARTAGSVLYHATRNAISPSRRKERSGSQTEGSVSPKPAPQLSSPGTGRAHSSISPGRTGNHDQVGSI
jgi:hypothetical protein